MKDIVWYDREAKGRRGARYNQVYLVIFLSSALVACWAS